MKQTLNRICLVIILTFMNTSIAQADYGSDQRDIFWFSSSTSSLLNRSSVELATKHVSRGVRFAYQALTKDLNSTDELIAYHNLCIGYLASDRAEYASQFCARAFELAQGPYSVIKVRGALQLQGISVDHHTQTTLSPLSVLISNIQQQKMGTRLTLLLR